MVKGSRVDLYGGTDPRDAPSYTLPLAARIVGLPVSTLRSWIHGRPYPTATGIRHAPSLIEAVSPDYLSFTNLVEAYVLAAMRREHGVRLDKVRSALSYVERELSVARPLAREEFKTDGVDLFVERFGKLLNASRAGQVGIREALTGRLERVEYERRGRAVRLFPLSRASSSGEQPRNIVIDPCLGFGRPVIAGTGIRAADVADRFRAGDSAAKLAKDYEVAVELIEDALRVAESTPEAA